uniref:Uncharacterized protein n=1 Tax=Anguilla anguilla TaxID=7936 RepID=A0A0E9P9L1_ANGAN
MLLSLGLCCDQIDPVQNGKQYWTSRLPYPREDRF